MYSKYLCSLLFLLSLFSIVLINGSLNTLSGQTGSLRPDLVSIEEDVTDNDPSTFPDSVSNTRDTNKLWTIFSTDVTSEDKAEEYVNGLKEQYDCISESNNNFEGKYIYYHSRAGQYSAFLNIESNDDGTSCIDSTEISYDDYGLAHVDYDLLESTNTLRDLECIDDSLEPKLYWNLDIIDASFNDIIYTHPDTVSNIDTNNVDIFILDTGVLSTHIEFSNNEGGVVHGDPTFGDENVTNHHGTHVAGIAAGYWSGASKGLPIYDYPVCRSRTGDSSSCGMQDIFNGYIYVYNQLIANPGRRGVINMSFGGLFSDLIEDLYYDLVVSHLEDIYNAGGILVASAGNDETDACIKWPAGFDIVLSVGAAYIGALAWFSNYGECVDIYAPGALLRSSSLNCGGYDLLGGTSMAAPMMTGVVANMLSLNDELTFEEIKNIIVNSKDNYKLGNCASEIDGIDCYSFAMKCDDLVSESQFLSFEFDCDNVELTNECNNTPCDCNGSNGDDNNLEFCQTCNQGSGCSQCESGYIKIDNNHGCINCQDYFGDNCMHCSNGIGCQQCGNNVQRVYDNTCGLYYCPDE